MKNVIQPNVEVLKWARKSAGYTIQDVAEKLRKKSKKITKQTVIDFEKGSAFPTYSQLENLAYKIYNRPLAVFFFPEPPDESDIKKSFRTLPESIESLSPKMRIILRKARVMQLNVMELSEDKKSTTREKKIFEDIKFTTAPAINTLVKKVRKYLGISLKEQTSWSSLNNTRRDSDTALKKWRKIVQSHGVFVFKDSFKDSNFSGFCLYDKEFPVIYINNGEAKTRQIFTLFHELAHILFHTSGFDPVDENYFRGDLKGANKKIETMCNEFAGAFLVPEESLPKNIELKDIKKWADSYSVSQEVFLIRLLKTGKISTTAYNRIKKDILKKYQNFKQNKMGGGNYYPTRETYLGNKYISLAFSKYYKNQISLEQLADFLGVKPNSALRIEPHSRIKDRKKGLA